MTSSQDGCSQEMRARLSGPMPSLKTPFNRDGSIDFSGLRNLIDFNLAAASIAPYPSTTYDQHTPPVVPNVT